MFDNIKSYISKFEAPHYFVVVFALALQIQVTIFASDDYFGLRVSVADLLLPFAGLFIFVSLLNNKSNWPEWRGKYLIFFVLQNRPFFQVFYIWYNISSENDR